MKVGDLVKQVGWDGAGIVTKIGSINHCVLFEDGEHWYHSGDLELLSDHKKDSSC